MIALLYTLAIFVAVLVLATVIAQVRLGRHRGLPRDEFIREFRKADMPADIAGAVYDQYKSLAKSKSFSVNPDDSYAEVFKMIHDDIDEDAEYLVKKLGMEMPIEAVLREWPSEIRTLRDMVAWLNWIREHQPTKTA